MYTNSLNIIKKSLILLVVALFMFSLSISLFAFHGTATAEESVDTYPDEAITFSTNDNSQGNFLASVNPDGTNYGIEQNPATKASISPDGSKIVFDDGLYGATVSNRDGTEAINLMEAYNSGDIENYAERGVWSPDGSKLLIYYYNTEGIQSLAVINPDGTNLVLLADNVEYYNWSPDGSKIVMQWPYTLSDEEHGSYQIAISNADGSNLELIPNTTEFEQRFYPSWSPDGTKIAYISNNIIDIENGGDISDISQLNTINIDGTQINTLYEYDNLSTGGYLGFTAWSQDSSQVAFIQFPGGPSESNPTAPIYTIPTSGGVPNLVINTWLNTENLFWWKKSLSNSESQTVSFNSTDDTNVRSGQSNRNYGGLDYMRLQSSGSNRGLVGFDQSAIESALGSGTVTSAKLRLTITDNGNNWGEGRTVDVHRIISEWAEGNGTENSRGTGDGATWECAIDALIQNQAKDCSSSTLWEMGQPNNSSLHPWIEMASATQTITNNQTGVIEFDVTSDVVAFLNGASQNYGWLIKKTNEGQNGQVSFGTKESSFAPQLVITYQP